MNDEQYLQHCRDLMRAFADTLAQRCRDLPEDDSLRQLAQSMQRAAGSDSLYEEGPELVDRLFTTYPDFAPGFPRDLLWFLGGQCLHFMPDEEIALCQQADQLRREAAQAGEQLSLQEARARLQKLQ
jgi:hypothetical protein